MTMRPATHINSIAARNGVLTLYGYGIDIRVDRGHLLIKDGIAANRRLGRFPRVGHGLKRLIVIGSDGTVSLAAVRWLADQDAAFVMLERDGSVLATTGPVRPSDARLRRAQTLALQNGIALRITRELITEKLAGQEQVARRKLLDSKSADAIARFRVGVATARTIEQILTLESLGASVYWGAWKTLPLMFPRADLPKVPNHWRTFGTRKSLLSGSQRLATNPANAILNYLYAVLESETRLAVAALGLDPGLGFWHADTPTRDSLACDLMEPIRPNVDAFLLDWVTREPLKPSWFFEQRDGNCRLMSSLAIELSQTAPMWARAVAPFAEWVSKTLWSGRFRSDSSSLPATRLTQRHKRQAKGQPPIPPPIRAPHRENLCRGCGKAIRIGRENCERCAIESASQRLGDVARIGRIASRSPEARAKHRASRRRHAEGISAWDPASQPRWLTAEVFRSRIQPLLAKVSSSAIKATIGVSSGYAGLIRQGYLPHPRHWRVLADLAGVAGT